MLEATDGSNSPGFTVTSNYQYRVVKGSPYTLRPSRRDGDTGAYGFRFVTAKERRIPMTISQRVTRRSGGSGPCRPLHVYRSHRWQVPVGGRRHRL